MLPSQPVIYCLFQFLADHQIDLNRAEDGRKREVSRCLGMLASEGKNVESSSSCSHATPLGTFASFQRVLKQHSPDRTETFGFLLAERHARISTKDHIGGEMRGSPIAKIHISNPYLN